MAEELEKQPQPQSPGGGAGEIKKKAEANTGSANDNPEEQPHKTSLIKRMSVGLKEKSKTPLGGYDATPVPKTPPGLTVRLTFVRATQLPTADINSFSSDPFIVADLWTGVPTRHKEDRPLQFRTPTIRRSQDPAWNAPWIIANVPRTGFKLKARIYDEDPADHDDRLGNAHLSMSELTESSAGSVEERELKIKKRVGSKRAFLLTGCMNLMSGKLHTHSRLVVRVEVLGPTDGPGGKVYTIGPQYWTKHFSPMIGRIVGTKVPGQQGKPERYNFQANQIQLRGPVPDELYHRYVEFRPFIKGMFTGAGIRGFILNRALHHQHARVYNFDRSTIYGVIPSPGEEMTRQFLDMVHYDHGGRIFTYVMMLDGLLRFTETGKEFGIDLLSKHSMHSDVSIYIAWSGEFFIRRSKQPHPHRHHTSSSSADMHVTPQVNHKTSNSNDGDDNEAPSGTPAAAAAAAEDPHDYELIIDNDSGTYRPKGDLLPVLQRYLETNLPGLRIRAMACDDGHLVEMKKQQRERKKASGEMRTYIQRRGSFGSHASSLSSSDIEDLDERARLQELSDREGGGGGGAKESKREKGLRVVAEPKKFVGRLVGGGGGGGGGEGEKRAKGGDGFDMMGGKETMVRHIIIMAEERMEDIIMEVVIMKVITTEDIMEDIMTAEGIMMEVMMTVEMEMVAEVTVVNEQRGFRPDCETGMVLRLEYCFGAEAHSDQKAPAIRFGFGDAMVK
ncbi:MAG: hypothetical protein M1816_005786 [Peltula sp. TS41687]|nr:MAG: hypothetical protein M1816_005786 [Peltula sp. TS41687]